MKFSMKKHKNICSTVRNLTTGLHHQLKDQIKNLRSNLMTKYDIIGRFKFCRDRKQNVELRQYQYCQYFSFPPPLYDGSKRSEHKSNE